jgi:hypothetical protein
MAAWYASRRPAIDPQRLLLYDEGRDTPLRPQTAVPHGHYRQIVGMAHRRSRIPSHQLGIGRNPLDNYLSNIIPYFNLHSAFFLTSPKT